MDPTDLILIIVSIAVSALCSGLEIAFLSSNKLFVELERKRGAIWARLISGMFKRPGRLLGVLLVGNNIALVLYGVLMAKILEPWLISFDHGNAFVLISQTIISTLIILVVAEFLPKTVFRIDPGGALAIFAIPLQIMYIVLWPAMMVLTGISELVLRAFGIPQQAGQAVFGRVDLDQFLKEISGDRPQEKNMDAEVEYFKNTLELSNIKVRDLITPRAEIEAVEVEESIRTLRDRFVDTGLSKMLIYKKSIDNIIGYVHGYEMFKHPRSIRSVMRPVNFIPGTMPADDLLQMFIKQRTHMAVVVDEYGGTDGVVTLEDVLEELVGEIVDETDVDEDAITRISRNEILAWGDADLREINHFFNVSLPQLEHRSLNGYLLDELGRVPQPGEQIEREKILIEVMEATETQVTRARLRRLGSPMELPPIASDDGVDPEATGPEPDRDASASEPATVARARASRDVRPGRVRPIGPGTRYSK